MMMAALLKSGSASGMGLLGLLRSTRVRASLLRRGLSTSTSSSSSSPTHEGEDVFVDSNDDDSIRKSILSVLAEYESKLASEDATELLAESREKVPLVDFKDLFSRHNTSLPDLKKRILRGKVVASNERSVYVDLGLHRLVRFPPYELKRSKFAVEVTTSGSGGTRQPGDYASDKAKMIQNNLHKKLLKEGFTLNLDAAARGSGGREKESFAEVGGEGKEKKASGSGKGGEVTTELAYDSQSDEVDERLAEQREWREQVEYRIALKRKEKLRVGDHIDFDVHYFYAYDGSITAEPRDTPSISTKDAVWKELQTAFETKRPVPGRILNPVNKGYAVGIAGIVAFLPESFAPSRRVGQTGVLQWFEIVNLGAKSNNVLVRCAKFS